MRPLLTLLALATLSSAHMHLTHPAALNSTNNPHRLTNPDNQLNSPHNCCGPRSHYPLPCRGYLSLLATREGARTAEWAAGSQQLWSIAAGSGGGNHWGGSCQVGFVDFGAEGAEGWVGSGGKEEEGEVGVGVRVVRSYEGDCPHRLGGEGTEGQGFGFRVPGDLGWGTQVFVWGWWNREGEFNVNCAVVNVTASEAGEAGGSLRDGLVAAPESEGGEHERETREPGSGRSGTGKKIAFASRPLMLLPDPSKKCLTPLRTAELKYPDPGPDVLVGDDVYPLELPKGDC